MKPRRPLPTIRRRRAPRRPPGFQPECVHDNWSLLRPGAFWFDDAGTVLGRLYHCRICRTTRLRKDERPASPEAQP